jgi:hypothetical protein
MDPKTIETLIKNIHRRFPEVTGIKPKVRKQPIPKSGQTHSNKSGEQNYLLTFQTVVQGPGGQKIPRSIRVVATPQGKIVKISTSK